MGLLQSDSSKDPKLTSVKLHLKIMRKKKKNCRKSQILSFKKAIPTTNAIESINHLLCVQQISVD